MHVVGAIFNIVYLVDVIFNIYILFFFCLNLISFKSRLNFVYIYFKFRLNFVHISLKICPQ